MISRKSTDKCLFCQIVSGKAKSWTVYEDGSVKAFLNIYPLSKGHTLIVPKIHYEGVNEIPVQTLRHMVSVAKKLTIAYGKTLGMKGVSLHSQDHLKKIKFGHYHLHVVPRYDRNERYDFASIWPKDVPKTKPGDLEKLRLQLSVPSRP